MSGPADQAGTSGSQPLIPDQGGRSERPATAGGSGAGRRQPAASDQGGTGQRRPTGRSRSGTGKRQPPSTGQSGQPEQPTPDQAQRLDFTRYVEQRGPALLRTAVSLTGNRSDAEDLLQTALVKTYFAWDRITSPRARDSYIRRAMVNTQISQWRRQRIEVFPTDEIPEQYLPDPTVATDLADVVNRAVAKLPQRQRVTVRLRYFEDRSEAEVAALLGVSVGTVKSTVSRAIAKLRNDAGLAEERSLSEP